MSKIDWEKMRNSPATIGAVALTRSAVDVVKIAANAVKIVSRLTFEPAFWYGSRHPGEKTNAIIEMQVLRTLVPFVLTLFTLPTDRGEYLPKTLENWGLFAVGWGFLAGAAVDWVGLGLQAIGNSVKKGEKE